VTRGRPGTHHVTSSTNGREDFVPDPVTDEFVVDFLFDFSHIEKGVLVCADEDDGNAIFCPDV
jgi:hypothetical protein